jgi:hypothetical protein
MLQPLFRLWKRILKCLSCQTTPHAMNRDDERWVGLPGGYRVPYDLRSAPPALKNQKRLIFQICPTKMAGTMRLTISALLLAAALPAFADDLTIQSKVTRDGGPPQTTSSYISSDHVRMSQGDGKEVIIDLKAGDMTTLDTAKKTYYVVTRQDMEAMTAKMQEQMNSPEMKRAQEQLNNLPPEQKARMEAMMGGMLAVTVEKSGGSRKIAGLDCDNWTVSIGQFSTSEECVTTQLKYPVAAWEAYKGFADTMKTMMAAMGPMASGASKMQEQFKKIKGFPLASTTTTNIMGHKSVSSTEVTAVKYGPIPASAFEIPAGYTKVDNPMLKQMDRMGKRR